ncbi:tetratricopeptide repeat-containing diguanylate cyclase [Ornatilinea apprima]|uniref:tetratricopeptide repeat-containing diguanylate cyclase n=1 Tax=Ornatilinea apprima TaxID=1134406 RepID=UPI00094680B1|nr:GGDEF domain-containing protein [Ornatilinea apprima]
MSLSDEYQVLERKIDQATEIPDKVRLALDLADRLQDSHPKVSNQWVEQALAWIANDPQLIFETGRGLMLQGNILLRQGLFAEAQEKYLTSLEIARQLDHSWLLSHALCGLGGAYICQDQYGLAMETLIHAQNLAIQLDDADLQGYILINLGGLYLYLKEHEEATRFFKSSAAVFERTQNTLWYGMSFMNLVQTALDIEDYPLALEYLAQFQQVSHTQLAPIMELHSHLANGACEARQSNHTAAIDHYDIGLRIAEAEGLQDEKVELLQLKSRSLLAIGQVQAALQCVKEAYTLIKDTQYKMHLRILHDLFSQIYDQMQQYQLALEHHRQFHRLDAEITAEITAHRLRTNEALFRAQNARKEAEIVQFKNLQLEREIIERRRVEDALRKSEDLYRRQAQLDPLTGITNRRFFYEIAQIEIDNARAQQLPISVILFDLDHFKQINDTYGHLVGDQVLKLCAARVAEAVREMDVVCRFGGEEFIILLPGATPAQTSAIAQRLFERVSKHPFQIDRQFIEINLSVGLASRQAEDDLEQLIEHADQAMYAAKRAGRNCIMEWNLGFFTLVQF